MGPSYPSGSGGRCWVASLRAKPVEGFGTGAVEAEEHYQRFGLPTLARREEQEKRENVGGRTLWHRLIVVKRRLPRRSLGEGGG